MILIALQPKFGNLAAIELIQSRGPDLIGGISGAHERIIYGFAGRIGDEVLLSDVSNIHCFRVLGERMAEADPCRAGRLRG